MLSITRLRGCLLASRGTIVPSLRQKSFSPLAFYTTQASSSNITNNSSTADYYLSSDRITEKDLNSRKTYLMDLYKHINDTNEILLYVHHNNLNKADNKIVRSELSKINNSTFHYLRVGIYRVYLRNETDSDPAAKGVTSKYKDVDHPLSPLLNGPTAIISIPKGDPENVSKVLKLIKKHQDRLILIGAKVEKSVYDIDQVNVYKDLPDQLTLQSQLAGLLTILGGAGLVRTLETASTHLYLTLEERRKDIDPSEKKEEEEGN
ncbi:hypothetical protein DFJ63DRAFT_336002 [Scheffersomyces coipomensis]|uniref:uncharacterized protein n=1 Tax=Scheffersomyces coipomensis TaxID=1788519 RepID=UPI00315D0B74